MDTVTGISGSDSSPSPVLYPYTKRAVTLFLRYVCNDYLNLSMRDISKAAWVELQEFLLINKEIHIYRSVKYVDISNTGLTLEDTLQEIQKSFVVIL